MRNPVMSASLEADFSSTCADWACSDMPLVTASGVFQFLSRPAKASENYYRKSKSGGDIPHQNKSPKFHNRAQILTACDLRLE
eukprot:1364323-Amorphochlora_amoeboformis.AAC.2